MKAKLLAVMAAVYATFHSRSAEAYERAANYTVGGTGIGVSLVQATDTLQFIAALGGAILVCRQLYRDIKKK